MISTCIVRSLVCGGECDARHIWNQCSSSSTTTNNQQLYKLYLKSEESILIGGFDRSLMQKEVLLPLCGEYNELISWA